jgi:hypothetical protein
MKDRPLAPPDLKQRFWRCRPPQHRNTIYTSLIAKSICGTSRVDLAEMLATQITFIN